jgi:PhoPQ-activated pathogenicity-related protein
MRPRHVFLLAFAIALAAPSVARADLDEYLARPEPKFHWEKKAEEAVADCKVYTLALTSQEWQGFTWEHTLFLVVPEKCDHPEFCTLLNTGGRGSKADVERGTAFAKKSGSPYAVLFGIPNQPLWDRKEDSLVVFTWLKFIESMKKDGKGDESWPLHFPMAKAVIKAMDAIQAFAKEAKITPIEGFLVCGASKRGWTTWLVGASKDPRVKAIAPMVIDTLNVPQQAKHQMESWGKMSEQIGDYVAAQLGPMLASPEGKRLMELEDPWSYRERLTLPKLIINGTNDRYWTQDSLNLYWDDLKGTKSVLYVPNSGHGLEDRDRLLATLAMFARVIARGGALPKLTWTYEATPEGGVKLALTADRAIVEGRLFKVASKTLDFRDSKWAFEKMSLEGATWSAAVPKPVEENEAVFGEAVFEVDGERFTLSSQIRILATPKKAKAKRWY